MNYKILKDEHMHTFKRSVDIEIQEQATSSQIAQMAQKIFKRRFDKTFMLFYLPGEPFSKAYAVANWEGKECSVELFKPVSEGIYAR